VTSLRGDGGGATTTGRAVHRAHRAAISGARPQDAESATTSLEPNRDHASATHRGSATGLHRNWGNRPMPEDAEKRRKRYAEDPEYRKKLRKESSDYTKANRDKVNA
jgi:hypothetical protein